MGSVDRPGVCVINHLIQSSMSSPNNYRSGVWAGEVWEPVPRSVSQSVIGSGGENTVISDTTQPQLQATIITLHSDQSNISQSEKGLEVETKQYLNTSSIEVVEVCSMYAISRAV